VKILGLSCFYHDSAACLIDDGEIVAAAQEERFTRKKHDDDFPANAVRYCLAEGAVGASGLDAVAFYDKPILKFHRILETSFAVAPSGLRPFVRGVPLWLREKLWIEPEIQRSLEHCGVKAPEKLYFPEHHSSSSPSRTRSGCSTRPSPTSPASRSIPPSTS
jgi:carbamoyltransferase